MSTPTAGPDDRSPRAAFVELFGEDNAARIESAANDHKSARAFDEDRGFGSDAFRWAVLMALSFECLTRFAESHGFTCAFADVDAWLKEPAQRQWLATHDGDVDMIAMLVGVYTPYMPEPSDDAAMEPVSSPPILEKNDRG